MQSPKKSKKEKEAITVPLEDLSPLAQPLAEKKLGKKLHKTIKKGQLSVFLCKRFVEDHRSVQESPGQKRCQGGRERHTERGEGVRIIPYPLRKDAYIPSLLRFADC